MKPGRERPGYRVVEARPLQTLVPSMKPGRERPGYSVVHDDVVALGEPSMKPGRERPGYSVRFTAALHVARLLQ